MNTANQNLVDVQSLNRAYLELSDVGIKTNSNAQERAQTLDAITRTHIQRARQHTLALGPLFLIMRDHQLYSHLGFDTFAEWLSQTEIDMKVSAATDIINLWKLAIPALEAAGMSVADFVNDVSLSKARLVIRPIRLAIENHEPMSNEDIVDLLEMARTLPYEDLQRHVKPSGAHNPSDNPDYAGNEEKEDPYIRFHVKLLPNNNFEISGSFDEDAMLFIERRLKPIWVGSDGNVLRIRND